MNVERAHAQADRQPPASDGLDHGGHLRPVVLHLRQRQVQEADRRRRAWRLCGLRPVGSGLQAWLEKKGLNVPFYERYAKWAGGILTGDLGKSYQTNEPVATLVLERLKKTGILGFWVFALMIPLS